MRSNSKAHMWGFAVCAHAQNRSLRDLTSAYRGRSGFKINSNKHQLSDAATEKKRKFNGIADMPIQEIIQTLLVEI